MPAIASRFASSVARGVSSTGSMPSLAASSRKACDVAIGVLAQAEAFAFGAGNGLVVHVGEVHDVAHLPAADVLQGATEHVDADEGAEVADVPAGVDGEAAGVHPDGVVAQGLEGLLLPRQRVVKAHRQALRGWVMIWPATLTRSSPSAQVNSNGHAACGLVATASAAAATTRSHSAAPAASGSLA